MSGNWIYCGSWTEAGAMTQRRGPEDPSSLGIHSNWAWSWPSNRRVLYNRASCDVAVSPGIRIASRSGGAKPSRSGWASTFLTSRLTPILKTHMGPFIMMPEGVGRLFVPLVGFADGPFPEHYEPIESPIANPLHPEPVEQSDREEDSSLL